MDQMKAVVSKLAATAKARKRLLAVLAVIVVLQMYFVRELIAAELLFGLGFLVLFAVGLFFYLVGALGERLFFASEAGARVIGQEAIKGYAKLEEVAKRTLRHPSETAQ